MVPLFQRISLSSLKKGINGNETTQTEKDCICTVAGTQFCNSNSDISYLLSDSAKKNEHQTYGSFDLGIRVPSSFIRSLMLNLRLLSTADKHEWQEKHKVYLHLQVVTKQILFDLHGHEQNPSGMPWEAKELIHVVGMLWFWISTACHKCSK